MERSDRRIAPPTPTPTPIPIVLDEVEEDGGEVGAEAEEEEEEDESMLEAVEEAEDVNEMVEATFVVSAWLAGGETTGKEELRMRLPLAELRLDRSASTHSHNTLVSFAKLGAVLASAQSKSKYLFVPSAAS